MKMTQYKPYVVFQTLTTTMTYLQYNLKHGNSPFAEKFAELSLEKNSGMSQLFYSYRVKFFVLASAMGLSPRTKLTVL
jgi:hypothetical protein